MKQTTDPKMKYPYCSQKVGGLLKKIVLEGHRFGDNPLRSNTL